MKNIHFIFIFEDLFYFLCTFTSTIIFISAEYVRFVIDRPNNESVEAYEIKYHDIVDNKNSLTLNKFLIIFFIPFSCLIRSFFPLFWKLKRMHVMNQPRKKQD